MAGSKFDFLESMPCDVRSLSLAPQITQPVLLTISTDAIPANDANLTQTDVSSLVQRSHKELIEIQSTNPVIGVVKQQLNTDCVSAPKHQTLILSC